MLKDIHFTLLSDTQRFETWLERFRLAALPHQLPFSADKTLWIFHLPTFLFTSKSKSDLGWKFLFLIETGRFKDYHSQNSALDPAPRTADYFQNSASFENNLQQIFFRQAEFCQFEILPGPGKLMRWGVPDGLRDPASGDLVHDDLLISAALSAVLDDVKWGTTLSEIIPARDPLKGLGEIM